jgi:hypothetical protein
MSQVRGDRRAGVTVRAPGKVNLTLSVGPRRPDGYHELTTVFLAVGLHDVVRLAPAPRLTVTVRAPAPPTSPPTTAIWRRGRFALIARAAGVEPAVAVHIDKRIPVSGGMAGGSADAAAALVGCDALWGLGLSREEATSAFRCTAGSRWAPDAVNSSPRWRPLAPGCSTGLRGVPARPGHPGGLPGVRPAEADAAR